MSNRSSHRTQPALTGMINRDATLHVRPLGKHPRSITDLYNRLIGASWPAVAAWFAFSFIAFNLIFALLYWVDPGALNWGDDAIHASRFWRCFFFSVQTVATIGYGSIYPITLYANILVVVEITLGILFFALATGIIFARFSRPSARILFSHRAVVAEVDGVPTLMLRAANQRRNLIFEANASLSMLCDDHLGTAPMRRFRDLALVRNSNPAFALTWTILHPIGPDSPLAPWLASGAAPPHAEIVVVLSGTDSSSGQIIYGRWAYTADDIFVGARFVDILGRADDGIRTIDYDRFHDIEPDRPGAVVKSWMPDEDSNLD